MRKLLAFITLALPVVAGCAVHQDQAPSTTSGPAEAAFSLKMLATPDSLVQDGAQTSTISVTAFGPDGKAVAKTVQLTLQGVGTLTPAAITTPGTAVYRPPAATSTSPTVVTILGTIVGTTGDAALSAFGPLSAPQVTVTLRPPSSAPPAVGETPTPIITSITPASPTAGAPTLFNATSSCPSFAVTGGCARATSTITNWDWDFGDGSDHGSGVTVTHTYLVARAYPVVLTVTNSQNRSASTTSVVTVGSGIGPTALFTALPNPAAVGGTIALDGSASTGTPTNYLYTITSPGAVVTQVGGSSPTNSFTATVAGTWSITLTVMDATGRTNTSPAKQVVVQ
jgi:PKD repeat protein